MMTQILTVSKRKSTIQQPQKNAHHQWLCGFFSFLRLPSAGYQKLQNRLQHVSQVQHILEVLDPDGDDITILGNEFGDTVWTKWVHPHLQNNTKVPGAIISYVTSLEKFYMLVTSNRYNRKDMPPLHGNYLDIFKETISALKGWRATVDNETQHIQHRGFLKECDTILTTADIMELEGSKPYRAGIKALNEAKAGKKLSLQEFTDARDLLLPKQAIQSRPGGFRDGLRPPNAHGRPCQKDQTPVCKHRGTASLY